MFGGVAINLAVCWLAPAGVPWNVMPIFVFTIGTSVVMPSVTLMLLDLFPTMRGMASSLQGFVAFMLSAVNAGTISPALAHSLKSLALGMLGFTIGELCAVARIPAPHQLPTQGMETVKHRRTFVAVLGLTLAAAVVGAHAQPPATPKIDRPKPAATKVRGARG